MPETLTCLADYLTYEEGILLYTALDENGIPALVKSCGPPSIPFGEGLYFKLLVAETEIDKAREIFELVRPGIELLRQKVKCPRCKSIVVFPVQTLPFWQKLYYAGTQVMQCENCGKHFGN